MMKYESLEDYALRTHVSILYLRKKVKDRTRIEWDKRKDFYRACGILRENVEHNQKMKLLLELNLK